MHISYRCAYMEENTNTNTSSNNNNNTNNNVTTTSLEMMVLRKWDTLPMVDWSIKVISLGQTMFPKFLWLMIWIFERKTCFNRNTCFYTVLKWSSVYFPIKNDASQHLWTGRYECHRSARDLAEPDLEARVPKKWGNPAKPIRRGICNVYIWFYMYV